MSGEPDLKKKKSFPVMHLLTGVRQILVTRIVDLRRSVENTHEPFGTTENAKASEGSRV
jgi:hypothetical protein